MVCLALLSSDASDTAHGDPEHRSLQIDLYREKTVQCLIIGEYTKSGPYVLETMIHYVYIELILRGDADKDIWFLFALEVNLAMRMGYHRDPSNFPGITTLQSEMRRRLWATVLQGDMLISTQMGMPRMISDLKWDTAEPRNLSDNDFDDNTTELPPPRPETELTPALSMIARRRMFLALGAIGDITSAAQPCGYPEVMRVDGILHQAAASIPPPFKPKPLAISVTDTPEVIMSRLFIMHLFYKGQILLHRRFLYVESTSPDEDVFAYSRTTCLDASLSALDIQHILDEETGPGGQLYTMRWRVSSIMNHTFLTATMVLCSMLHRGRTLQREDEILRALRRTRTIWMRASSGSLEAKKAAETVSIVLARVGEGRGAQGHRYDKEEDDKHVGRALSLHQGTLGTAMADHVSVDGSLAGGAGIHGHDVLLQDNKGLGSTAFDREYTLSYPFSPYDPKAERAVADRFVIPGLLGTFTPPDAEGQTINFNYNPELDNMGILLDKWIQTNNRFEGPPS